MFQLNPTGSFKKDFKICKKRRYDLNVLNDVLALLMADGKLPAKYKPHILSGDKIGLWECHIKPDWLLLWYYEDENTINLVRTGTHSDLF